MLLLLVAVLPNLIGAAVVLVLALWILPLRAQATSPHQLLINVLVFAGYLVVAVSIGVWVGHLLTRSARRPRGERDDDAARERAARRLRRLVLRAPTRLTLLQSVLWAGGALTFLVLNLFFSWRIALQAGADALLGGLATVSITYRLVVRVLRTEVERVFADQAVPTRRGPSGVLLRTLGGWLFGTAVPVLGVMLAAVAALSFGNYSLTRLAVVVLILGGVAVVFGGAVITLTALSTSAPVQAVRRALRKVERGDFAVDVPVFDTSELGQLQAGFNTMVVGLRERERVRDLFGRQVGEDVAKRALENEVDFAGEVVEVSVLFVDLIGSTRLAATRPPSEVVTMLNDFFAVVIDVVEHQGGWINKFEGDAALAIFGAPTELEDAAGRALAAGRTLAERLEREVFPSYRDAEMGVGVGVSSGEAVAGNIGDERRYEYTVIGDPVNEAARLCEFAKELDGRVAASGDALAAADADERGRWRSETTCQLRGRTRETEVMVPAASSGTAPEPTSDPDSEPTSDPESDAESDPQAAQSPTG